MVFGLYIAIYPFIPELTFLVRDDSPETVAPYTGRLAIRAGSSGSQTPQGNRIVIPSIGVDEPILESSTISAIDDGGTWRRPNTSVPVEGSNTVIVGHRWFGNSVSTFYHLDKLDIGEVFAIYWEGQEILYRIASKGVVDATEVAIENPTSQPIVTIYTCDPVWSAANRLVITATPLQGEI